MKRRISFNEFNPKSLLNQLGPESGNPRLKLWLLIGGIGIILGVIFLIYLFRGLPTLEQLERVEQQLSTKLYSQDNQILKELYFVKRTYTPLDSIPATLKGAVLATEDRDFYDHWGFHPTRFIKAMLIDLLAFRYKQGASTLSQQLARGLFLTQEKKIIRKIRELLLAIQIEYTYTKPEIFEMYMNHMYFGHGAYGVQAAAQKYFNKDVISLNLVESALLTALLPRPNYYSPYRNPEVALRRRNTVLHNMLTCRYITREEFEHARNTPIEVKEYDPKEEFGIAPYFTEMIRQELQTKYGLGLYTDGLSVYTTLDSRVQVCAEAAVKSYLPTLQEKVTRYYRTRDRYLEFIPKEYIRERGLERIRADKALVDSVLKANITVQTACVALDPTNGYILAMIGGRNFEESKYNRVVQARRQPGSAFKPIAYATAIDNGYSPATELLNQPVVVQLVTGEIWKPLNYDHSEGGPTTLREGLRKSYNLIAVRLVQELVPPSQVVDFAHKLGIESQLDAVDAIALGCCGVTPLELTSAYCVFDNKGIRTRPMAILRVEDKYGNVLEEHFPEVREALREEVAYVMTNMLQTVIDQGTGAGARSMYHFYRPAAGKTGTTNDYTDGWFVGFTPQIVAGVWCGLDDPKLTLGSGMEGARVAVPIWAPFMRTAHDTLFALTQDSAKWGIKYFEMPDEVIYCEICAETKKLANESCPDIKKEIFIRSSAPKDYCEKHKSNLKSGSRRHY